MAQGLVETTQGPVFIGFMFNAVLYGTLIAQVYIYYTTYPKDKLWMKFLVFLILVADTANTAFDFTYLYRALIIHFGDTEFLTTADLVFSTDPAITGIVAILVQLFFAWRLGVLTKRWYLVAVVCLGATLGCAGAIATSVEVHRMPHFVDFHKFKSVVIIWLASSVVTDLVITTVLVWFFFMMLDDCSQHKHKSGFKESDLMVNRIIRLTVQTGLITSLVASLDLILFLGSVSGVHFLFNLPLCKLYSNSLMSSLNARRGWKFTISSRESGNVHSECTTSMIISSGAADLGKSVRPESVELRDMAGSRQQELPCSLIDRQT